jgi:CBS domain-containing protein
VDDVMTRDVATVRPDTPFHDIVDVLINRRVSAVPVVDRFDHVVGVVSEADLMCKVQASDEPGTRIIRGWRRRAERAKVAGRTAEEVMSQPVVTALPSLAVAAAARRMADGHVKRLPVIDAMGHLVGIVTRSDIEGAVSFRHTEAGWHEGRFALAGTTVTEVMTRDPLTVSPDTSMHETATLLLSHHLSGLPVVEAGKLVGIITETDVFRLVVKLCEA